MAAKAAPGAAKRVGGMDAASKSTLKPGKNRPDKKPSKSTGPARSFRGK